MSEQFYSEDGCDKWLAESGLLPETGVYVDAGCAHPWKYSQTAFLRNRGWTGLAIDGNPAYAPEWAGVANAKFVSAVLSDHRETNFLIEPTNALVSRVHEIGQKRLAFTLSEIMQVNGFPRCDFLALDIEGSETPVLRDFLLPRSLEGCPKFIIVEFNSCHKGRDVGLLNLMADTPYVVLHMTDSNLIFSL